MVDDLLGRDDPAVDRDRLDQQRHVRRSAVLWALVSGHWSAWQAARVEVAQVKEKKRHEKEDVAADVVERMVEETEVHRSSSGGDEGYTSPGSGDHPDRKG